MSNVTALHSADPVRSAVIDEVRAHMGRRRVSASALGRMTGTTQAYWSRRLTGMTAFDVDDLANLSRILQVPMTAFLPFDAPLEPTPTEKAPTDNGEGQDLSHLSESNRRPIHYKSNITPLPARRVATFERETPAPVTPIGVAG